MDTLAVGYAVGTISLCYGLSPISTCPCWAHTKKLKRGKQIKKRGISNEQVCIATAIDRNGNIILEPICTGRISHYDLESLYKGHIDDNSIICTDSHKSYIQFATNLSLDHKRIMI